MITAGRRATDRVASFLGRTVRLGHRDVPVSVATPLVVAAVIRAVFAFTDNIVGPDEAAYLETGRNIVRGRGIVYRGHPQLHFPPLLPMVLGVLAKLTPEPHHATVLLTFVTSLGLVALLGALATRVAGPRAGVFALWIAALSPGLSVVVARSAGGSEAPYTFLVFAAALLAIGRGRWDDPPSAWCSFLVGLLVGAAYLVRPEGISLVVVFGFILAIRAVGGRVSRASLRAANLRRIATLGLACGAGLVVMAAPYVAFLHSHSGKWELTAKTEDVNIDAWQDLSRQDRVGRDTYLYKLDATGRSARQPQYSLTALARAHPRRYASIVGENLKQLYKSLISFNTTVVPGGRLFALPLLPFALIALWRRRSRPGVIAVGGVLALSLLTVLAFFVQNRYLAPAVAALAVLAAIGLAETERRRRVWVALGLVASLLSVLTYFVGPHGPSFGRERPDLQIAARWMRGRIDPNAAVMTRSAALPYYLPTNRLVEPPVTNVARLYRYAQLHHVRYFILDPSTQFLRPELRPLLDGADHTAEGFKTLHTVKVEDRTTVIFELVPATA